MTITARGRLPMTALAVLGLAFGGTAARAASGGHITQLAQQVQRQARGLRRDVYDRFRQTTAYPHLDRDAVVIERLAGYILAEAGRGEGRDHLKTYAQRLDQYYHHLLQVVDYLARTREADPRSVADLRRTVTALGQTVHHLTADLGAGHDGHGHGHGGHGHGGHDHPH